MGTTSFWMHWQILLEKNANKSLLKLPSSMSAPRNLAGIPSQACYLGACVSVHPCACWRGCSCVCFSQKKKKKKASRSRNRFAGRLRCQPEPAAEERNSLSIHLPRRQSGRRSSTAVTGRKIRQKNVPSTFWLPGFLWAHHCKSS